MKTIYFAFAVMVLAALTAAPAAAQDTSMSFFVTSVGSGDGGNLGGLRGADAHCKELATAVGEGNKTWRAYLSIGSGPWYNADGVMVARDVEDLHSDNANINNETALTENGEMVNQEGQGNRHDILTGSRPNGTAWPFALMDLLNFDAHQLTCNRWTSNDPEHSAMIGHHDRGGQVGYSPWNAAHPTVGCNQEGLVSTGGAGLFYCFAAD
jgi:hypothetical protein